MHDATRSRKLSRTSRIGLDPLSDVLDVLGAAVTRRSRIEAAGDWALSFPSVDRLKFVALLRGQTWILVPDQPAQRLQAGDVCLIGPTNYAIASDPALTPTDGRVLYDGPNMDVARISGDDTIAIGGTVTFAEANADFLLDMLPSFNVIPHSVSASGTVTTLLTLMSGEIERDMPGREIVDARLADILLVEAIRAHAAQVGPRDMGWLGALLDPRLSRALAALHKDIAHAWTVAELAGIAGMSRAAFSADFARRVGQPPLSYLRTWRLTKARAALVQDAATVAEIANAVGYQSQSAFSQAFRRAFGASPKAVANFRRGI
ncbi:AraC family transcriptional regulator [Salipiger bermudensis]|uniref:AraC family transcriptional regulator n=1 Tax=Salipiger bermudensis TaxID=344736 RepID=UPI001CD45C33|nr:AraC family transcriptional regulator [Salipiger bermudensis]MCA0964906.1 AraC family transcriptional regulator [Salipiger bermudensis]